jgi:hypothetical protein
MKNSGQVGRKPLSAEAAKLKRDFLDHWDLTDPSGVAILNELCACFDRLADAKNLLAKNGHITVDRFGQQKLSPAAMAVNFETANYIRWTKALGLEVEGQDNRPGRPDGFMPKAV